MKDLIKEVRDDVMQVKDHVTEMKGEAEELKVEVREIKELRAVDARAERGRFRRVFETVGSMACSAERIAADS